MLFIDNSVRFQSELNSFEEVVDENSKFLNKKTEKHYKFCQIKIKFEFHLKIGKTLK